MKSLVSKRLTSVLNKTLLINLTFAWTAGLRGDCVSECGVRNSLDLRLTINLDHKCAKDEDVTIANKEMFPRQLYENKKCSLVQKAKNFFKIKC